MKQQISAPETTFIPRSQKVAAVVAAVHFTTP